MINMIHLLTGQVEYSKLVVFWISKREKGSEEKMKEGEKERRGYYDKGGKGDRIKEKG